MTQLMSFSGKAMHGKDTCADLVVRIAKEELDVTVGRFAFAWPLKARVYGESPTLSLADVLYNKPPELRTLLQQVGTERGRDVFGEHFWTRQADALIRLMSDAMPDVKLWVISDCRFPNEVDFTRTQHRGTALWIDSDRPTLTGAAALHPSETALDALDKSTAFSGRITNNQATTLDDLAYQLRPHLAQALGWAL